MTEKISAFLDGELEAHHVPAAVEALCADPASRAFWKEAQLIGDAMRAEGGVGVAPCSDAFARRLMERIMAEPVILAPVTGSRRHPVAWAVAAGVAALVIVGAVAFQSPSLTGAGTAEIATSAPALAAPALNAAGNPKASAPPAGLPADADDYLVAHRGFSPRAGLPAPSPFARTVSEERLEGNP